MTDLLVEEGKMHTAGPWSVSGVRSKLDGQPYLFVLRPDGRSVAAIPYSARTNQDHVASHADARLIAAAPDMLVALKAIIEWYSPTPAGEDWSDCMIQAAAAIAKAAEPRP